MRIFVPGAPPSKGSFRVFRNGGIANSSRALGPWTKTARERAATLMGNEPPWREAAFGVTVWACFERPKGHFTRKGALKEDAPEHVLKKPDADKTLRAVLDALTGILYHDDSQVICSKVYKLWADEDFPAGTLIVAEKL